MPHGENLWYSQYALLFSQSYALPRVTGAIRDAPVAKRGVVHLPLTTDEGDGQPPDGELQRMINKDVTLCDEWEAMVLVVTTLFCEGEHARVAMSCLRDRPPRGT